jgi:protein O-mannosyl-transferase
VTVGRVRDNAAYLFVAIFAATLLAYAPAIRADFIWNDSDYVTAPALRSLHGLARIWFELGATEQYYPILHSAFWVEHRFWGDSAMGYHIANILLHAMSACLLVAILRRLAIPGAWFAGFIFALHPVYAESVAWVSEQKNTLSLVFYLAAALAYLRFDGRSKFICDSSTASARASQINLLLPWHSRSYWAATFLFVLALLSKSTTATLPPALLVVLWWKRGRLEWKRDVMPLLPWFVLGAAMGLLSAWVEKKYIGAEGSEFALSLLQRTLLAGRIVWFYLGKLLWPGDLIFIYPRWNVEPQQVWQWLFLLAAIVLVVGLWFMRRSARAPLAAALFFGGSLFPVLGFFNVYAFIFSFVADHWQYLPSIGIVVFGAAVMTGAAAPSPRNSNETRRGRRIPMSILIVLPLGLLTFNQSRMYADMRTFYRTTLARNPAAWMAHNNLGNLLRDDRDLDGAIAHFEAALRARPDLAKVRNNLASALRDRGRVPEAIEHYRRALELDAQYVEAHNNLGNLLRETKQLTEGIVHLTEAVRLDPNHVDAQNNLGVALRDAGRMREAIAHFERAVKLNPRFAPAHLNLALSFSLMGREAEAMNHYREARRLNPAIPELFAR